MGSRVSRLLAQCATIDSWVVTDFSPVASDPKNAVPTLENLSKREELGFQGRYIGVEKDNNSGLSMVSTQSPYLSFAKDLRIEVPFPMDFPSVIHWA